MWRIGVNDLEDYIAEAYRRTAEHIAAGEIVMMGSLTQSRRDATQPLTRTPPTAPVHGVSPGLGSNRCAKTYPC
ncbi:hypothetical protein [Arthrobacter sp. ISL-72]|uniref:hypothetical protein n=1 Tax=Arthrobacter sp. ISL-72 TaxID=2819114 RepID=UPI00288A30B8|nr:hypothetical protein [Arthrobacter sp. ISL-72]